MRLNTRHTPTGKKQKNTSRLYIRFWVFRVAEMMSKRFGCVWWRQSRRRQSLGPNTTSPTRGQTRLTHFTAAPRAAGSLAPSCFGSEPSFKLFRSTKTNPKAEAWKLTPVWKYRSGCAMWNASWAIAFRTSAADMGHASATILECAETFSGFSKRFNRPTVTVSTGLRGAAKKWAAKNGICLCIVVP